MKIESLKRNAATAFLLVSPFTALSFTSTAVPAKSRILSTSSSLPTSTLNEDDFQPAKPKEADLPKYSQSIPFLKRPKELKFELAGDVGFDPLNFAKNKEALYEYREAEIKHGILANVLTSNPSACRFATTSDWHVDQQLFAGSLCSMLSKILTHRILQWLGSRLVHYSTTHRHRLYSNPF